MTEPPVLITHPDYRRHLTFPGHPERPERVAAIESLLRRTPLWEACEHPTPEPVDEDTLARVHTRAYIRRVHDLAAAGGGSLDPDTPVAPASDGAARRAAGGALLAVDTVIRRESGVAAALVRPPGHHAGPGEGRGFCIFNNAALAARHALDAHGLARVFILDWDVHHGNGTQEIFYRDPAVVCCSLHQEAWYPGTGGLEEMGEGPGEGTTINIPLPAGIGDGGYQHLFEEVVIPLLHAVAPPLIVVSAGYDAHHADPLGGMVMTARGFGRLARSVREAAPATPIALMLEGGYDLSALAYSVAATLEGFTGIDARAAEAGAEVREVPFSVAQARARAVRRIVGEYWTL
ncbi:MAG TPA: histone deacetylase [bacterium]|nr:histone deacetylase [bacterium]